MLPKQELPSSDDVEDVDWDSIEGFNPSTVCVDDPTFTGLLDDVLFDLPFPANPTLDLMGETSSPAPSSPENSDTSASMSQWQCDTSKSKSTSLFYPPLYGSGTPVNNAKRTAAVSRSSSSSKTSGRSKNAEINEELIGADADVMMKKQQRMMRNRESASLSRKRRKEHLESMEKQVEDLTRQLQQAKERIQHLEQENAHLRQHSAVSMGVAKPAALGGVSVLMVCLLVFGLFAGPSLPTSSGIALSRRPNVPMLAQVSDVSRVGRTLKSVSSELATTTDVGMPKGSEYAVSSQSRSLPVSPANSWNDTEFAGWIQQRLKESVLDDKGRMRISNNDVVVVENNNNAESPVFRMDEQYRPLFFSTIKRRADTSYVLCTEVQFFPGTSTSEDDHRLSLVFPSRSELHASNVDSSSGFYFVEVDCDVVNTQVLTPQMNDTVDA